MGTSEWSERKTSQAPDFRGCRTSRAPHIGHPASPYGIGAGRLPNADQEGYREVNSPFTEINIVGGGGRGNLRVQRLSLETAQ